MCALSYVSSPLVFCEVNSNVIAIEFRSLERIQRLGGALHLSAWNQPDTCRG